MHTSALQVVSASRTRRLRLFWARQYGWAWAHWSRRRNRHRLALMGRCGRRVRFLPLGGWRQIGIEYRAPCSARSCCCSAR